MFVILEPMPIFGPCQHRGCGRLDASGNVRLRDDTGTTAAWCREHVAGLLKALPAAVLVIPPVSGGGPASFDYDPLDLALIACWEAEGGGLPSADDVAA
jgi:hypothetical protein